MLDAEALSVVAHGRSARERTVRAAMTAAARLGREVVAPAVVLAELYREPRRSQLIDACLSRETGIAVRDTDRRLARIVGGVLAGARVGSEHLADAHVVAVAVEVGGGVLLTADPGDLGHLSAAYGTVLVVSIAA